MFIFNAYYLQASLSKLTNMPLLTIAFLSFNSFRDYFAVWSVSRIMCIVDFSFSFVLFSFKISTNFSLKASEKATNKVLP